MKTRIVAVVAAFASLVAAPKPAQAAHHLWRLQQLYSNATGSVQFVELETTSAGRTGETQTNGFTVASGSSSVTLTNMPPTPMNTQWILLATSSFVDLPGAVAPDFIIPQKFFATGGGTITYASGVDSWNYGAVPTDGVQALKRDPDTAAITTGANAPVHFAGNAGSVTFTARTRRSPPGNGRP